MRLEERMSDVVSRRRRLLAFIAGSFKTWDREESQRQGLAPKSTKTTVE